jgi:hypothetical protein
MLPIVDRQKTPVHTPGTLEAPFRSRRGGHRLRSTKPDDGVGGHQRDPGGAPGARSVRTFTMSAGRSATHSITAVARTGTLMVVIDRCVSSGIHPPSVAVCRKWYPCRWMGMGAHAEIAAVARWTRVPVRRIDTLVRCQPGGAV